MFLYACVGQYFLLLEYRGGNATSANYHRFILFIPMHNLFTFKLNIETEIRNKFKYSRHKIQKYFGI